MYKDEIWYRKIEQAIEDRRESFTDKQWAKFRIDELLRVANRVREFSDGCETCRDFQHTLTRLEEEFQELPGSKAQRQYQGDQLLEIEEHFAKAHRIALPRFYLRKRLKLGLVVGAVGGFIGLLVVGNLLLFPLGIVVGAILAVLYGLVEDQTIEREHRRL